MTVRTEQQKREVVDKVAGLVRERARDADRATVEAFVRLYYRHVPPDDILGEEVDDLYGAALGLLRFAEQRRPGTPRVRAFNPRFEEHGWHTSHTVVEIVNDDMPFLVDSVASALNRLGLTVHLVIHPIVPVIRDADGRLLRACLDGAEGGDGRGAAAGDGAILESFMHIEVDEQSSADALATIRRELETALADVRAAVEDWAAMRERVREVIAELEGGGVPVDDAEAREVAAFLRWLDDDHFTFLGYREYGFTGEGEDAAMHAAEDTGLGILRDPDVMLFEGMRRHFGSLPPDVRAFVTAPQPVMVTKANRVSTVHRSVQLDTVIVKRFDAAGAVVGERQFTGLLTSVAYNRSARDIPYLRAKVARVLDKAGVAPRSHDGKALAHILDTYPRDELFQIGDDELLAIARGILDLQERQRTALFVRKDPFERFVSCLVYVPRERYDTDLRRRFQAILERAFEGEATAFYTQISEGVHARIHFIVKTTPGRLPDYDAGDIEGALVEAGRSWSDHLQEALIDAKGEERGLSLLRRYRDAFPTFYREHAQPQAAILDIERIEETLSGETVGLSLYRPIEAAEHEVRFKLYHRGEPVPLSDVLPMLEHMGLKVISENPSEVTPAGAGGSVWLHDFEMQSRDGRAIDLAAVKPVFQDAFARVWAGEMEDDGFNRLVLGAGLDARSVALLRAVAKYLRQARIPFSQASLEDTLAAHPRIAALIVALFEARFDPGRATKRDVLITGIKVDLDEALDAVANLDEDRILRRFINVVEATLRTNAYQPGADGRPKSYIAFKLDSRAIDDLPLPRPWVEIFVYSPRVEAVHLRGGKVARGGIRWSDRREDFRTEILGLMKAQMVKNAVIVPVGSKGGFVVKRPPREGGREAIQAEGIECYKTFMRGMLDVTDNLVTEKGQASVVHPPAVLRRDEDDPYLVVAADKGTATFSDIANGIAAEYGFWLDDAFASGGSAGYDHKKMGITARGAWESVKRHFREIGHDTQSQPFSVVGVGDMSGDVFGNGMLLSRHIRLVGAFNHLHVFLDPDPDPEASFAERERLFAQGRGSWDQYDTAKISKGGGVFDRKAKSITLSVEARKALGLERSTMTPNELIAAMLRAPVDLLWFGGIGTYVKAEDESHAEVGDKANDALRVDARAVRARVIGEGANLGVTQRGRIEYAHLGGRVDGDGARSRLGGRLNTDFIDNSAGVDCSDHEVNIKILTGSVVRAGDMTIKQRNALLERMTDEVSALVLRDNYLQTQALSLTMAEGPEMLDQQARFMRALERGGKLDRRVENLPDDEELTDRLGRREGLTRPELCVLLCYAKITLYDEILSSDLPDEAFLAADLERYFPTPLQDKHASAIHGHTLRREIVATSVTNSLVNRTGPTFMAEMTDKTGMGAADVTRAYLIVRDAFGLRDLWSAVEALDTKVDAGMQTHMMLQTRKLIDRGTAWILRNGADSLEIGTEIEHYRPGIEQLRAHLDEVLYPEARAVVDQRVAEMTDAGVPEDLARRIAALNLIASAFDLIRIADVSGTALRTVGPVYFDVGRRLGIAWLRDGALRMQAANHWQKQAVAAIVDDLYALQADLTVRVVETVDAPAAAAGSGKGAAKAGAKSKAGTKAGAKRRKGDGKAAGDDTVWTDGGLLDRWIDRRRAPIERIDQLIAELRALDHVDLSMLAVANRRLRGLMAG